jgi:osmotically-inducible protein OsmY
VVVAVERTRGTLLGIGGGVLAGVGLAYFLDPKSGRRRRHALRDRTFGGLRRAARKTARTGRGAVVATGALTKKAVHLRERRKPDMTDETLTAKIKSEVFRDPKLPKGHVNVNVEDGVAVLRGQIEQPELIDELVKRVRKVRGVRDVSSLLHVPEASVPTT